MPEPLSSNSRRPRQWRSFAIAAVVLGMLPLASAPAVAQVVSVDTPPSSGMGATSPFGSVSGSTVPPAGIPLGSTELASPGISPAAASPGAGPESCTAAGGPSSTGRLFDEGGLSASTSSRCVTGAASTTSPSPSSSIGSGPIPLGATELGGPGLSAAAPVAAPTSPNGASPCVLTGTSSAANIGC